MTAKYTPERREANIIADLSERDNADFSYLKGSVAKILKRDTEEKYDYSDYMQKDTKGNDTLAINLYDIQDPAVKALVYTYMEATLHLSTDFQQRGLSLKAENRPEILASYIHRFSSMAETVIDNLELPERANSVSRFPLNFTSAMLAYQAETEGDKITEELSIGEENTKKKLPTELRHDSAQELTNLVASYISNKYGVKAEIEFDGNFLINYYIQEIREKTLFAQENSRASTQVNLFGEKTGNDGEVLVDDTITYDAFLKKEEKEIYEIYGGKEEDIKEYNLKKAIIDDSLRIKSQAYATNIVQLLARTEEVGQDGAKTSYISAIPFDIQKGEEISGNRIIIEGTPLDKEDLLLYSEKTVISIWAQEDKLEIKLKEEEDGIFRLPESELLVLKEKIKQFSSNEIGYPVDLQDAKKTGAPDMPEDELPSKKKKSKSSKPRV